MKLTKQIKEAILQAALKKAGIPEKKAAIRGRYAEWANKVRVLSMPPEMEAEIEKAKSLVAEISAQNPNVSMRDPAESRVRLNVAGQTRIIFFNGNADQDDDTPSVFKRVGYHQKPLTGDDPLVEQLHAIDHDAKALKDETEQLTVSLWAVLNSVNTDKRLVEVWPEAVAFIPAAEKSNTPQLPALPIAELNKLIGLP